MPDDPEDLHERAVASWREVVGFDAPASDDPYTEFTVDHVFGRVWTRPGLSRRDRRLITLTCVAMAGQAQPLAIHVGAAHRSGDLDAEALHEWVLHLAHYAGWPVAATAYTALREALTSG